MRILEISSKEKLLRYLKEAVSNGFMVVQIPAMEQFPSRVAEYHDAKKGLIELHQVTDYILYKD